MSLIPQLLKGWTVLIVDDEEDSLDVAQRLLRKAGAHVLTACNGREALNAVREYHPDCVLSDLSMPEMDGWLLMSEMGDSRPTANIPVIALTAHAMPGDRQRAIEAGFTNYITKPLDARKFIEQLVAILVDISEFAPRFAAQSQSDPLPSLASKAADSVGSERIASKSEDGTSDVNAHPPNSCR